MNALFIMQVYSFRDLFMSFSVNKYLQHYQARQKSLVVKQSGRLVETVMEVIITTYFNINMYTHPIVLSKSQNHHLWNKHHHHHKDDTFLICLCSELLIYCYSGSDWFTLNAWVHIKLPVTWTDSNAVAAHCLLGQHLNTTSRPPYTVDRSYKHCTDVSDLLLHHKAALCLLQQAGPRKAVHKVHTSSLSLSSRLSLQ